MTPKPIVSVSSASRDGDAPREAARNCSTAATVLIRYAAPTSARSASAARGAPRAP